MESVDYTILWSRFETRYMLRKYYHVLFKRRVSNECPYKVTFSALMSYTPV